MDRGVDLVDLVREHGGVIGRRQLCHRVGRRMVDTAVRDKRLTVLRRGVLGLRELDEAVALATVARGCTG